MSYHFNNKHSCYNCKIELVFINIYIKSDYGSEDMGMTVDDLLTMHQATSYVAGLAIPGSSGDPSRFTARGTLRGIQARCI